MENKEKDYTEKDLEIINRAVEDDDDDVDDSFKQKKTTGNSKTPVLDSFSKDLTKMAEDGKLDIIVGRVKEIERVSQILSRRKKNNPILIGSPGTGKSSIAEGLAQRIVQRKCARVLFGKRIMVLDLASMVSGTKYRGEFEQRVKSLMGELEKNPDVILFIDEIHTMIGAGGASGSLDASNMFKPALARGELQIIGATTIDEYRKHIEKDGALERRFQKVMIEPASKEETLQILNNIKDKYESHHNVLYTQDAIQACIDLTQRYITDRHFPDKAIDALDEAGARVHISNVIVPKDITDIEKKISDIKEKKAEIVKSQKYEEAAKLRDVEKKLNEDLESLRNKWDEESRNNKQVVSDENVAEVVSMMTGIPLNKVSQNENVKLAKMYEVISKNVVGQDDAVKKVVKAIQRGRIGVKDPNKPIGVFLCLGDTGSGKTHLAKCVAKYMFNSEDSLIRLDMSEYMEKISINRIIGASSGYVGYEDANVLDTIRNKPYSVILLDEIEKAHPDVFNLFLQAFDEGHLTDSHGRKVNLKNTIIIMTSNIGARQLKDFGTGVGFKTASKLESHKDDQEAVLSSELKKKFSPEFINRIDSVVYFNSLTEENIGQIIDLELEKLVSRILNIGYTLKVNSSMREHLIKVGYDPKFGARPLKRAIQKWIEDEITEFIIDKSPKKDSTIDIGYDADSEKAVIKKVKVK